MSTRNIPSHYKLAYTEFEISQVESTLGVMISEWAKDVWQQTETDVLAIPVLRGGIFFYANLMPKVTWSVEMAPARTRAYEQAMNNVQRERVEVNIDGVDVSGRSVLLVDDICDSGRTLKILTEYLKEKGAREVRTAVLIKRVHDKCVFDPDYVGFEYHGPEWFVGYGMEDRNRWTNLPSIYTISGTGV